MKILKIMIIFLILIISAGAVCASESLSDDKMMNDSNESIEMVQDYAHKGIYGVGEASFTDFENEIKSSDNFLNVSRDYKFNNETDNVGGIAIKQDNLVINGNGHTIDADGKARIFAIYSGNITINNLKIINAKTTNGGAIAATDTSWLKTNNVTFENNQAGGGTLYIGGHYTIINDKFINNVARASAIHTFGRKSSIEIINGTFNCN